MQTLKEMGCFFSLDDFGSGYSSVKYLASMPVDVVKFDITNFREPERREARYLDSVFFSLHDEWYYFRMLNGQPARMHDIPSTKGSL